MLSRAIAVAPFWAVAFGGIIADRTSTVTSYLATVSFTLDTPRTGCALVKLDADETCLQKFEGIPANLLPVLSTAEPPSPYQGLNWKSAVVVKNAAPGQYVVDVQTDQGTQFIALNTLSTISFSTPDAAETFSLRSAYVNIYLSTDNSAVLPSLDGVLAFTGTKPDGSTVVETVQYTASGPGIVKEGGVVLLGKARFQKVTFSQLNCVTAVEVTVQSAAVIGPVTSLLKSVGLDVSTVTYGVALDSLAYDVVTPR